MDAPDLLEARRIRSETTMRDGRSAPRDFCIKCQVSAIVEPPAPIEKTSAPVRSKWRSGSNPSSARPEEIGSLAWQTNSPSRFERQLVSPMSSAWGSINIEKIAAGLIKVDLVCRDQRAQ